MTDPPRESSPGLPRVIGVGALTLGIINCIVGSAIFVVPASVASLLGPAGIVAYLLAGTAVVFFALCFAEVGSRVTGDGGAYAFIDRAFGPWAGFIAATLTWLANGMVASAAVANALVGTLGSVMPSLASGLPRALLLTAIYGGFAWINIRGTALGARTAAGLTIAKLIPLGLLVVVGAAFVQWDNLSVSGPLSFSAISRAALLLIFALTGMEIALSASGEVTNPTRTIPRAAALGVISAVALYLMAHEVAQGVLGASRLADSAPVPLAATGAEIAGSAGRTFILVGTIISIVGFFATDVLANPRALYALANRRLMPGLMARVHPKYRTPHIAILFYAAAALALAIVGSFTTLALLNALGVLLIYFGVVLALFRFRATGVVTDRPPIRLPLGPVIPLVALGFIVWLIAAATWQELVAIAVFLVATSLVFFGLVRGRGGEAERRGGGE